MFLQFNEYVKWGLDFNISVRAHTTSQYKHTHHLSTSTQVTITYQYKPLKMIKARTTTMWGKQKETLIATYKAVVRPAREYASSI